MKTIFVILFAAVALTSCSNWCYKGENCGQHTWPGHCQDRGPGATQTPINIEYSITQKPARKVLDFSEPYFQYNKFQAMNNGHSLSIKLTDVATPMIMAGDLMKGKSYIFHEMHFHGPSEHTFNGQRYPLELHLVHYNSAFSSASAAIASGQKDALAVVGLVFQMSATTNSNLDSILKAIPSVQYKDESVAGENLKIIDLIPDEYKSPKIYRNAYVVNYYGSLTTPDCFPIVFWTVCTKPVPISSDQMQQFLSMHTHGRDSAHNENLVDNYRDLQPLNGRTLEVSSATIRRQTSNNRAYILA